ncbi:hypothetical protein BCR44DRAFT_1423983 [Catenaria anguillulae PL171]|uniref:Uncharacterized protein n=1 Tax=Catenaria anguillulae PL171 TaxID=765915 RepID=A0A1Y2I211_9FUNG|nr:hypothetical protein BCR44DRAFT_1423983 [Catenaria anguillulae PL171]
MLLKAQTRFTICSTPSGTPAFLSLSLLPTQHPHPSRPTCCHTSNTSPSFASTRSPGPKKSRPSFSPHFRFRPKSRSRPFGGPPATLRAKSGWISSWRRRNGPGQRRAVEVWGIDDLPALTGKAGGRCCSVRSDIIYFFCFYFNLIDKRCATCCIDFS